MWMSSRIISALASSSTTATTTNAATFVRAAATNASLTNALGIQPRSQRLLSTLTKAPNGLEPFKPKMSRAHWVVHRHQPFSTKATQSGASMALVQSKTPYVPTVAATTAFSTSMPSAHWSRAWVTASVVSGSIFGPMVWSRVKPGYKVAYCAAPAASTTGIRSSSSSGSYPPSKEPLISTREITFGTVMGLGSGFLFKKLGKLILLVIGLGFVSLQLLANQGYVTVHWSRFERRFKDSFDLDGDGKVTVNDAKHGFRALIDLLTKNFQFKSTFIGGFVMGFRYG